MNNDTTAVAKVTEWIGITFGSPFLDFRGHNLNLRPGTIESIIKNRETRVTPVTLVLSGNYRYVLFKKCPDFVLFCFVF